MKLQVKLSVLSALNILFVFLSQFYLISFLGPGKETDSYFAGITIPVIILAITSGSLMHVIVPILAGQNLNSLHKYAWTFLFYIITFFGFLVLILYFTSHLWVPILFPGFSKELKILTLELTRIMLVAILFSSINSVQWATFHAKEKFLWAEFTPTISSIISFGLLIFFLPIYGIKAAAWIFTLRYALQFILLYPGMGKPQLPDFKTNLILTAFKRIKPLLFGTIYYKTDPIVDRFLLSSITSGSLSIYYLAQQIYSGFSQILNKAIVAPLVPRLSILHKQNNSEFQKTYFSTLLQVATLSILAILLIVFFGEYALKFALSSESFSSKKINELWWILIWLGGMLIGGSLGSITSASFYAVGNTLTPTRISIITYTLYIPIKILAFYNYGLMGLAITISVYYICDFLIQFMILYNKSKSGLS